MTTFTTPQSTPFPPDGAYPHTGAERSPLSINGLFALVIALVIIVTLLVTSGDAAADSPAQVDAAVATDTIEVYVCLLYTSPSPRDRTRSRMPSSA